jgi:heme/copper-type cytochrome/quinol oxidase subunit 4
MKRLVDWVKQNVIATVVIVVAIASVILSIYVLVHMAKNSDAPAEIMNSTIEYFMT